MSTVDEKIHKIAARRVNFKITASMLLLFNIMVWVLGLVGYNASKPPMLYYLFLMSLVSILIVFVLYLIAYKPFNKNVHQAEIEKLIEEEESHV
jgi:Na+/H+-dicarboxylate symporter